MRLLSSPPPPFPFFFFFFPSLRGAHIFFTNVFFRCTARVLGSLLHPHQLLHLLSIKKYCREDNFAAPRFTLFIWTIIRWEGVVCDLHDLVWLFAHPKKKKHHFNLALWCCWAHNPRLWWFLTDKYGYSAGTWNIYTPLSFSLLWFNMCFCILLWGSVKTSLDPRVAISQNTVTFVSRGQDMSTL